MSEDPGIREWFERSPTPDPSDAFVEGVMSRIEASQKRMQRIAMVLAFVASASMWFWRGWFVAFTNYIAQVFGHAGAALASPLTWVISVTVFAAAWNVARCREE
ncbi:MAG TPA: hypothetical protein VFS47_02820 [Steroidobacteraceae bacterium]|nr:hypothetical protein [Steroidobacteraceae bacterium]